MTLEATAKKHTKTEKNKITTYTYEECFESSVKYFNGDELAARVWVTKYCLKDSYGKLYELNPDQMHWRIANEIARIEKNYANPMSAQELYDILKEFKYIVPQGSPMAGIGNNFQIASLSNCFVIGNDSLADSYGGILKTDQEQVQLMKRRGGVGHDLSGIRPLGSPVQNTALTSTGIVPFMERYSNSTREVAQDGRRGALMLSLSVKHPDVEDFISAKLEQGKVTGANISVRINDEFMKAVIANENFTLQYPVESNTPTFSKQIEAKKIWNKIIHNAWKSAEPGILFWDTIINESVADCYANLGYKTISTNPCGEIPLCNRDSCRLLAINLYGYVENPFTPHAKFNFDLFKKHAAIAQRMMDDIIDLELEKIDEILEKVGKDPEDEEVKRIERKLWEGIRQKAMEGRRTGIGITGEGDMLAALGLRYGSDDATDFSVEVHKTLSIEVYRGSVNLAKERGAFTVYNTQREKNNPFINRLKAADSQMYDEMVKYGRRNISLLTIAPTGSTSILTQTTSGIEPVFMPVYKRRRKVNPNDTNVKVVFVDGVGDSWEEYYVFHHHFRTWLKTAKNLTEEQIIKLSEDQVAEYVKISPYYKATSNDVDWVSKVKMQGEIQKWVDHSISVTVNLPSDVNEQLVSDLYIKAWQSGCKGVTIYRDGSRDGVLISGNEDKKKDEHHNDIKKLNEEYNKRPKVLDCEVIRFYNNKERWIAFLGLKDGKPYEVFTGIEDDELLPVPKNISQGKVIKNKDENGRSRYDFAYVNRNGYTITIEGLSHLFNPEFWNYAKLISGVLRHAMPLEHVVDLVQSLHLSDQSINTWKNGVVRALKKNIPNGSKSEKEQVCENNECGSTNLIYQEGCLICVDCGTSHCA